jgi:hypothetical protein
MRAAKNLGRFSSSKCSDEGVGVLVAFAPSRAFQPGCVLQERSDEGGRLALRSDGSSVVLWIILGCPQILIRR